MFAIKIQSFPNREVRAVLYKAPPPSPQILVNEPDDPPLVITSKVETPPPNPRQLEISEKKAGYGKLGRQSKFTVYARRQMLRAGAVFDLECPKQECLFLTGTLPGSTDEAFRAIAEYSSYIVHCLKAWIAKRVRAKFDMYVWEWQKRGALHLHYAVHVPCRRHRRYIRKQFKREWIRLLDAVSRLSGVDLYRKNANFTHRRNKKIVRATAEVVRKSVACYLSKYLSKNANNMKGFGSRRFYFPARWYGCSRPLLKRTRELTEEELLYFNHRGEAERELSEITHALESYCDYTYTFKAKSSYGLVSVAYHDLKEWGAAPSHNLFNWILRQRKMPNPHSFEQLRDQLFDCTYSVLHNFRYSEYVSTFLSRFGNPWHLDLRRPEPTVALGHESKMQIMDCLYRVVHDFELQGQKLGVEIQRWKKRHEESFYALATAPYEPISSAQDAKHPMSEIEQMSLMEVAGWNAQKRRAEEAKRSRLAG